MRRFASRVYRLALRAFPSGHRERYGAEMLHTFEEAAAALPGVAKLRFVIAAVGDAIRAGFGERRRQSDRAGRGFAPGSIGRDLAHAVRSLAKARAFSFVSIVSLGIGLGTVILMLAVVRGLIGTPPAVVARGLVEVLIIPQGALRARVNDWAIDTWSYPDFVDVRDADTGLTIAGWTPAPVVLRTPDGVPARVDAMYVSPSYFSVVGVPLARGGGFTPSETPGQPEVVVSHRTWTTRLNAAPGIVGSTIAIDGTPHVIVGVAPEHFRGHFAQHRPGFAVWIPLREHPRLAGRDSLRANRDVDWIQILGRVTPGRTRAEAGAMVSSIMAGAAARHPSSNGLKSASVEPYFGMSARRKTDALGEGGTLVAVAGMVLLIVCLNMSGMMLVRSATRERELAVRLAIGATRSRLMQYLLAEAVVLAFAGGALGALVVFGVPGLISMWRGEPLEVAMRPDGYLTALGIVLCLGASFVFGLLPAIRFSRPSLVTALKDDAGGGGRRVGRVHRWTAAIQAGLAVPFIVVGAVQLNAFRETATADLGFAPDGLYALPLDLNAARGNRDTEAFLRSVRADLERAGGVVSAAAANGMPLDNQGRDVRVSAEGASAAVRAHTTRVTPEYLKTMGVALLRGRGLTAGDRAGSEPVALISQALALRLFSAGDPVGRRITFALEGSGAPVDPRWPTRSAPSTAQTFTVVGVTADFADAYLGAAGPQVLVSLAQYPVPQVYVIARGNPSPSQSRDQSMRTAFEHAISGFYRDPDLVSSAMIPAERLVRRSRTELVYWSFMSSLGAGAALLLSALGVFGVIGFMVATRTREIGIRIALGASQSRVLRGVLGDAVKLVTGGIAAGLAIAWVWVQEISWTPYGAIETLAFAAAALIALAVTLAAALPAARRAAAVEPLAAMRAE
jgi:predicted permease